MANEIILPKFGNSVEECLIMKWNKKVGDKVDIDDVLCEVETDKTTMDVLATESGILRYTFFDVDDVVQVLAPIAIIANSDEDIQDLIDKFSSNKDNVSQSDITTDIEIPSASIDTSTACIKDTTSQHVHTVSSRELFASPRAKSYLEKYGLTFDQFIRHFPVPEPSNKITSSCLLEEQEVKKYFDQISISTVALQALISQDKFLSIKKGSGIGGRIIEEDVVNMPLASDIQPITKNSDNTQSIDNLKGMERVAEISRTKMVSMRKIIADRMLHSLQSTAQLTLVKQVSAVALKKARAYYKANNLSITINDMIVYLVSRVLQENLWANTLLSNNTLISYADVNIGCAVQTEKGLMVPVVHNADKMSLEEIAIQIKELATMCKHGSISPELLQGGTFTTTNVGSYGIQAFTPVLNAPQTGILGIGAIDVRAIEIAEEQYEFEHCITLSLTFDHRAYDGADGAVLLQAFEEKITSLKVH